MMRRLLVLVERWSNLDLALDLSASSLRILKPPASKLEPGNLFPGTNCVGQVIFRTPFRGA